MTKINVTDERLGVFARKQHDWFERVKKGSLDPDLVEGAVQDIINTAPRGRFADEEVKSSYAYPNAYKVRGITEQTNILRQLFSGIGYADEKLADHPLPKNAEGWFAIPKWQTLAPTYGEAVQKVLDAIKKTRNGKFYNYREGQTGPEYLRQSPRTEAMFQKLGDEQKGHDILIVPCQFGLRHKGRSVRRARDVFQANEFGLGAFAIGIMLLTHPEREVQWEQLHVDCAGDEFALDADGGFSRAPIFAFSVGGKVWFDALWFGNTGKYYGSASAFLSQQSTLEVLNSWDF